MDQKTSLSAVAALLIVMSGSVALALDPLGPPKAGPAAGQFQIGADILYGAADLDIHEEYSNRTFVNGVFQPNQSVSGRTSVKYGNQPTSKLYANLGYGIFRNWEAFLRLGGADYGLGNDSLLTVGGGTKVTFYETGNWSFGGILQLSWTGWEDESEIGSAPDNYSTGSSDHSVTEGQAALGACYQFSPHFSLYGGPFATFFEGTSEGKGTSVSGTSVRFSENSSDTDVDAWFGGYLGLRIQIHEKATAAIEYQYTADAYAVAASIAYRFGEPR